MKEYSWKEAYDIKKLRISWKCSCPDVVDVNKLMELLYTQARSRRPAPQVSQDECFSFRTHVEDNDGYRFSIVYNYDYDYHSMYDQSEKDIITVFYSIKREVFVIESWLRESTDK